MGHPVAWEMNKFGQYEGFDEKGHLVCVQKPKGKLKEAIDSGLPAPVSKKREISGRKPVGREVPYSRKKADEIFNLIIEGKTILKICAREDMPSRGTFYKWIAKHPQFKAQIEEAKKLQAEAHYDTAIDIADSLTDPKQAKIAKIQIDTHKWAAGVRNPNEYQPRPKEENRGNIFIINTGIERDERAIEVEKVEPDEES